MEKCNLLVTKLWLLRVFDQSSDHFKPYDWHETWNLNSMYSACLFPYSKYILQSEEDSWALRITCCLAAASASSPLAHHFSFPVWCLCGVSVRGWVTGIILPCCCILAANRDLTSKHGPLTPCIVLVWIFHVQCEKSDWTKKTASRMKHSHFLSPTCSPSGNHTHTHTVHALPT